MDYLYKTWMTLSFILRNRPRMIFATSPPSLCVVVCGIYCKIARIPLIIDAHNTAFRRLWLSVPLYGTMLRMAEAVLVHNDEYTEYLRQRHAGVRFFTLHDRIPDFSKVQRDMQLSHADYFLVILSYHDDEPVGEIFEAIASFLSKHGKKIVFKITGNYRKRYDLFEEYHEIPGIEFLGFVSNADYENVLFHAFGAIAMTTSPMLQQCAVVEAMGAGVPLIGADTDTNRRILFKGAVLTAPEATHIERTIEIFIKKRSILLEEMKETRTYWKQRWEKDFMRLDVL